MATIYILTEETRHFNYTECKTDYRNSFVIGAFEDRAKAVESIKFKVDFFYRKKLQDSDFNSITERHNYTEVAIEGTLNDKSYTFYTKFEIQEIELQ